LLCTRNASSSNSTSSVGSTNAMPLTSLVGNNNVNGSSSSAYTSAAAIPSAVIASGQRLHQPQQQQQQHYHHQLAHFQHYDHSRHQQQQQLLNLFNNGCHMSTNSAQLSHMVLCFRNSLCVSFNFRLQLIHFICLNSRINRKQCKYVFSGRRLSLKSLVTVTLLQNNTRMYNGIEYPKFGYCYNQYNSPNKSSIFPRFPPHTFIECSTPQHYDVYSNKYPNNGMSYYVQQPEANVQQQAYQCKFHILFK
uniref:CUB domain-containing protein n=1 Tax=Brugia timori TaxID=42155 RepID=A0A0R3R2I2_9BILA